MARAFARIPSARALTAEYGPDAGPRLRALLDGQIKTRSFASVVAWEAQCYNPPSFRERVECAANEIAGTSGAEALFADGEVWPDYVYLNAGDSYATTLIFDYRRDRVYLGAIGDVIERDNGRRYR